MCLFVFCLSQIASNAHLSKKPIHSALYSRISGFLRGVSLLFLSQLLVFYPVIDHLGRLNVDFLFGEQKRKGKNQHDSLFLSFHRVTSSYKAFFKSPGTS